MVSPIPKESSTIFHEEIRRGNIEGVSKIIEDGYQPTFIDLRYAMITQYPSGVDTISMLILKTLQPQGSDQDMNSALRDSFAYGLPHVTQAILQTTNCVSTSILMNTISAKRSTDALSLLSKCSDEQLNSREEYRATPLEKALENELEDVCVDLAKRLKFNTYLEKGNLKLPPLFEAIIRQYKKVVLVMLDRCSFEALIHIEKQLKNLPGSDYDWAKEEVRKSITQMQKEAFCRALLDG